LTPTAQSPPMWRFGPATLGGPDQAEMQASQAILAWLAWLPLDAWMAVQIRPLTPHPGEPGLAAS
jgi:muconolactone delta-isomerase